MAQSDIFIEYPYELLSFMREQHRPVFHNSNIFLRDVQFAIQDYFEDRNGKTIRNDQAEKLASEVARAYEQQGIFQRVNPQGYVLNFPELATPKDGGTIAGLSGVTPDSIPPPKAAAPAPAAAPAAKPAAPAAAKPAAAPAASAPAAGGGAMPAGAKAPPPWLKK
ncbi:MAG TPA: hypothetical protein VFO76_08490 [Candidatus Kapabacteria bacterium]|nr:hypothetical protein [Candidatus Kapabacteria bacterium]